MLNHAPGNAGSFPAGTASGCYVPHFPTSAWLFFAFRFVLDFRRRQPIVTIQAIFSDGSSETKCPLRPKRNALPKRAGKPPEGLRRNLRDTGGEKIVGRSGMASGKKTFARRDVLRSRPQSGHRAAAARCPRALRAEFPHPFCGSGPAGRGPGRAPGDSHGDEARKKSPP